MPTPLVNLDALIQRDDFEVLDTDLPQPAKLADTIRVTDLERDTLVFHSLRKPDFQRETANWEPEKVADFVTSFLDGDLIPSVILWRNTANGVIFVIDGAHRLSALIAWAQDDYGDGALSREFFNHQIAPEQLKAAEKARALIKQRFGSYQDLKASIQSRSSEMARLARNVSAFSVQLQWLQGDARKAETSFFKINSKATPIDQTELQMIEARRKPNALAARALIRAGVGHQYWSGLPAAAQDEIRDLARAIYDVLFIPPLPRWTPKTGH